MKRKPKDTEKPLCDALEGIFGPLARRQSDVELRAEAFNAIGVVSFFFHMKLLEKQVEGTGLKRR